MDLRRRRGAGRFPLPPLRVRDQRLTGAPFFSDLRARVALRRVERRLRRLQDAYYGSPVKEDAVILDYSRTLAYARHLERSRHSGKPRGPRLHLGSGDHRLEGWINVDVARVPAVDVRADCAGALPLRDGSIELIHSEDLLEHLDLARGLALLRDCFRVLRPGGVMRLLTPDLEALVRDVYLGGDERHLSWCAARLSARGPCESFNAHMRMGGEHRFLYDEADLRRRLREIGFRVSRVAYNRSRHSELRYLDLRNFGLNLFLEATKPPAGVRSSYV